MGSNPTFSATHRSKVNFAPILLYNENHYACSFRYTIKDRFRKDIANAELLVGIPMALQYAITSVGMLVIQASLNLLGTLAVTAYSAGNKIDVILEQGPLAIGSAMATYSAQNFGAGKIKRIKQGGFAANQIMIVYYFTIKKIGDASYETEN